MSDHERIWLEPEPESDPDYGRMWAQNDVWGGGVEYVLASKAADEITRLTRELEEAKAKLAANRIEVLEQAAKVAEAFEVQYASERDKHAHGTPDHWMNNSGSYAAMDIATAIRALKKEARNE